MNNAIQFELSVFSEKDHTLRLKLTERMSMLTKTLNKNMFEQKMKAGETLYLL